MAKICSYCGYTASDESRFCSNCGKEFTNNVVCPSCGRQHGANDRFCPYCGRPTDGTAAPQSQTMQSAQPTSNNAVGTPVEFNVCGVVFRMIPVTGGTFMMGGTLMEMAHASDDEYPAHQVTLDSFMIGETEVTQELWTAVMGKNPSHYRNFDFLPVDHVSWDDCQEFLEKLNELTGKSFRLPTEAEWEFAARGGNLSKGYKFSGSDFIDEVAWYEYNGDEQTHPVAMMKPNELGLYDMTGNVWEWCQDRYGEYSEQPQVNPKGAERGGDRVMRGGGMGEYDNDCRNSARSSDPYYSDNNLVGPRLAL